MKLSYDIYIRVGKEGEIVPLENIPPEKKKQLGKEMNDKSLRAAGYIPDQKDTHSNTGLWSKDARNPHVSYADKTTPYS